MRRIGLRRMCGGGYTGAGWTEFRRVDGALIHDRLGWAIVWAKPMWPTRRQNRIQPHFHVKVPTRLVDVVCLIRGHDELTVIDRADLDAAGSFPGEVRFRIRAKHVECRRCGRRAS